MKTETPLPNADTSESLDVYAQVSSLAVNKRKNTLALMANMFSSLLLRISGRTSFIILSFYLGEHFSSAAVVALILETFYLTELALAPIVGSLSDRFGRRLFLLLAPIIGALATLSLIICTWLFPHPNADTLTIPLFLLLALILCSRLLEGSSTALNNPASLGHIVDATTHSPRLRTRVMTIFEVITIGGMAFAIPFGGIISSKLGLNGFFVVLAVHALNVLLLLCCFREEGQRTIHHEGHSSLSTGFRLLKDIRIASFLPAWLAVNTLIGSWLTLIVLMMTYPTSIAEQHPHQLFYGGYSKEFSTLLLGAAGLLTLAGMCGWVRIIPRLRLTASMGLGVLGFALCILSLTVINGLGDHLNTLTTTNRLLLYALLPLASLGILLLSGFTIAALAHMANISDIQPGKRGATMGIYSVVLGIGQLLGATVGGIFVDLAGFYGLMLFSSVLVLIALGSISYMRYHAHDMLGAKDVGR